MLLSEILKYWNHPLPAVISFCGAGGKTSAIFDLAKDCSAEGKKVAVMTTTRMMIETAPRVDHFLSVSSLAEIQTLRSGITMIARGVDDSGKIFGFEPDEIDQWILVGAADLTLVEADGANRKPIKAPREGEPRIPVSSRLVIGVLGADAFNHPAEVSRIHRLALFLEVTGLSEGCIITPEAVSRLVLDAKGLFRDCPAGALKLLLVNKAELLHKGFIEDLRKLTALPVIEVKRGIWT